MNDAAHAFAQLRAYSRYADRLLSAQPELVDELAATLDVALSRTEIDNALRDEYADAPSLARALRQLRQRVMLRVMARDLAGLADLPEVCAAMTTLADASIRVADAHHHRWLAQIYGEPVGAATGRSQRLAVGGMGQLGGGRLKGGSDARLGFFFPGNGGTQCART